MATTANSKPASGETGAYSFFTQLIKEWLVNLDVNLQLFVEIMKDEAMPVSARMLAIGVLLYIRMPIDIIPDKLRILGLIDDVIIMVVGLSIIVPLMSEDQLVYYRQKYKAVARIDEFEQTLRSILGILWERLAQFVANLENRLFRKKTTEQVVQSEELQEEIHDATMIFVADLGLSPEEIDEEIKKLPPPEKVISLLASGLQDIQKREEKEENPSLLSPARLRNLLTSGKDDN